MNYKNKLINSMLIFQSWLKEKLGNKKNVILVLLAIVLVGAFLRVYKHHEWLYFDDDQANDAIVVDNYIQGKTDLPELGPNMGSTKFRLGPMFHYFQIVSAEIFGTYPDKLAYPDLFFSILTIPLLFYFLRKYFSANLALSLTGLYAVSYFALKFSRFAWNTNSMPFYILLFLLALSEIILHREKVKWGWILALGVAVGVGVQLHAMLLVIFLAISGGAAIWLLKNNWRIWPKVLAVVFVVLFLNGSQIKYELDHSFKNTRYFFKNADDRSGSGAGNFFQTLSLEVACHAQANTYILAALGDKDNCNFLSTEKIDLSGKRRLEMLGAPKNIFIFSISILFSLFGYYFLIRRFREEKERERKVFLGVVMAYLALFFVIMFASIKEAPLRYFLPMFFLPYIFLGIFAEELMKKFSPKKSLSIVLIIFVLVAAVNAKYLFSIAKQLGNGSRSGTDDVILGELEMMRDYIIETSAPHEAAYFTGGSRYIFRFYRPMQYISGKKNFAIERIGKAENMNPDEPVFYVYKSYPEKKVTEIKGMKVLNYKNFGQVAIYEVEKTK